MVFRSRFKGRGYMSLRPTGKKLRTGLDRGVIIGVAVGVGYGEKGRKR